MRQEYFTQGYCPNYVTCQAQNVILGFIKTATSWFKRLYDNNANKIFALFLPFPSYQTKSLNQWTICIATKLLTSTIPSTTIASRVRCPASYQYQKSDEYIVNFKLYDTIFITDTLSNSGAFQSQQNVRLVQLQFLSLNQFPFYQTFFDGNCIFWTKYLFSKLFCIYYQQQVSN
ncbi:unnamed protein product [Paramecium octaurelia]|uniref:Uncharacterized protein n=1 Tax=Paramecium octaurelia TaxID=43137 RepID=A0A8S1YSQ2_PAROT|nr:unnamed protein product [Paramecium octaurelia]